MLGLVTQHLLRKAGFHSSTHEL